LRKNGSVGDLIDTVQRLLVSIADTCTTTSLCVPKT
jgi:hypothetical protein